MNDTKNTYNPSEIEAKWQKAWDEKGVYKPNLDTAKKPFFNLMMFPYPSAEGLHVGSVFTFTGVDTYGRFKRMQGYDVFEPMGLDGFGIHSENYSLKVGRHPKEQAKRSEENFYRQLKSIGNSFDWSRKLETYDPNYYKWTQWIFIQLFKAGLAYRKKAPVNFCPSCKTVLADEQVIDGKCERCNSIVEKRDLEQWFFKITTYADRLLNNLEKLDWTARVKIAQKEWIGRKEGATISFVIARSEMTKQSLPAGRQVIEIATSPKAPRDDVIEVFTTRGDTLYGATFIVLAPEHPISLSIKDKKVQSYIQEVKSKPEIERLADNKEKTGIFSGFYAINPLNSEKLPVWIADYALMGYGTGALFGDAHDERDVEFAKKYKIPLKPTIITGDEEKDKRIMTLEVCYTGYGTLVNSGEFSGLSSEEAMRRVVEWLTKNKAGGKKVTYHLRDWLISRQRYWGPPIPMIYCEKCKWQPVPDVDLPVLLPDVKDWKPKGDGSSPLANIPEFVKTTCPNCKGEARRETDVTDVFLDSSWYFFRYLFTEFQDIPFGMEKLIDYSLQTTDKKGSAVDRRQSTVDRTRKWLPVTMYIGGAEHSVLHLLYSRFITMVFKDLDLISFEEPYKRFYAHGLIIKDGVKMSKSKGNVINPDEYLTKYGVDVLRAYLRFVGPFDQGGDFRDSGIEGMEKFLKRVWTFVTSKNFTQEGEIDIYLKKLTHEITVELEHLRFNTSIAKLMMYYNFLVKKQSGNHPIFKSEILNFIKLLAPFVPFLAEELWERLGQNFSVHTQSWPKVDEEQLKDVWGYTIVIQINGKIRATMDAEELLSQEEAEKRAKEMDNVKKHLEGKEIKKVIFVPGKIINFVIQ